VTESESSWEETFLAVVSGESVQLLLPACTTEYLGGASQSVNALAAGSVAWGEEEALLSGGAVALG
jgi:hypothetical protein